MADIDKNREFVDDERKVDRDKMAKDDPNYMGRTWDAAKEAIGLDEDKEKRKD